MVGWFFSLSFSFLPFFLLAFFDEVRFDVIGVVSFWDERSEERRSEATTS